MSTKYTPRKKTYEPGYWLNSSSRKFLSSGGYLHRQGMSVEARIWELRDGFEKYLDDHNVENSVELADKFRQYLNAGWYSIASPIWSNYNTDRGLPISCNGSFVDDHMDSILYTAGEIGMMSKHGSGTSAFIGALRPAGAPISAGGVSNGPAHFSEIYDTVTNVVSQANVRRGNIALYMPVEHPDIMEFLEFREHGHKIQKTSLGVTITDKWMEDLISRDPEKVKIAARIIRKRFEKGFPYILFSGNVARGRPDVYKDKDMTVHASNLCAEIALPASNDESFVCCLSSMNLLHYDEWKDTDAVEVLAWFLDSVIQEYIDKIEALLKKSTTEHRDLYDSPIFLERALRFAKNHRAIGLGTLGWHSYLQSNHIAFESERAFELNIEIHKLVQERSYQASRDMAAAIGEPPLLRGYGRRNTTLNAIAPTTSSSFILGQVSQSIEPWNSLYFESNLAKLSTTIRNHQFAEVLDHYGMNNEDTWESILNHGGSVQHLSFLSDEDKAVYKTYTEIDQAVIIKQAADRAPFIDQSQSINLKYDNEIPTWVALAHIVLAWKLGVKTLYYQHGHNPNKDLAREIKQSTTAVQPTESNEPEECIACAI